LLGFLLVAGLLISTASNAAKVTVCHFANDNKGKVVPITINEAAWEHAHKKHYGDYLGPCAAIETPIPDPNSVNSYQGISFTVCDDRTDETGRLISVSKSGSLKDRKNVCN